MAKVTEHFDGDEIAAGTVIDGRYRVVRAIGQGGAGLVYEVEHTRTGRPLALKVLLDETGFARLEQEARAASLMKNGHTARIVDMEPGGPTGAYMVMELLDGQSLRALLDEAGQLPLELTVNIALQVCECLHEAHALGIIHRDLKPENVFLCPSPWPGQYDVKVLDFGVMKIAGEGGAIPEELAHAHGIHRRHALLHEPRAAPQLGRGRRARRRLLARRGALRVPLGAQAVPGRDDRQPRLRALLGPADTPRPPPPRPAPDLAEIVMRTLSVNRDERPGDHGQSRLDAAPARQPRVRAVGEDRRQAAGARRALGALVPGRHDAAATSAVRACAARPTSASARTACARQRRRRPADEARVASPSRGRGRGGRPARHADRDVVKGVHGASAPAEAEGEVAGGPSRRTRPAIATRRRGPTRWSRRGGRPSSRRSKSPVGAGAYPGARPSRRAPTRRPIPATLSSRQRARGAGPLGSASRR